MSAAEKLSAIAANVPLVYEAGGADCRTKHFAATVLGDGSGMLQVKIPFAPDYIAVNSYDPLVMATAGCNLNFCADLRAVSHLAGVVTASRESSPYSAGLSHSGLEVRYTRDADGTVTFYDMPCADGATAGRFLAGAAYVVIALKYTDKTDRERVIEFLQRLTEESGALTMSRKIVTGAFPGADEENSETGESMNEEWNRLKQQYAPNCTIAFA